MRTSGGSTTGLQKSANELIQHAKAESAAAPLPEMMGALLAKNFSSADARQKLNVFDEFYKGMEDAMLEGKSPEYIEEFKQALADKGTLDHLNDTNHAIVRQIT